MKIYTKTGDNGTTGLIGGDRLSKSDLQIEAYGTVDELNSHLGLLACQKGCEKHQELLIKMQSILFDIGSHLAIGEGYDRGQLPALKTVSITDLETGIDEMDSELTPLKNFILPGGHQSVSLAHVCRSICRRAERRIVALNEEVEVEEFILIYLNRLSDYLFVLSRWIGYQLGAKEIPWIPQ